MSDGYLLRQFKVLFAGLMNSHPDINPAGRKVVESLYDWSALARTLYGIHCRVASRTV